MLSISQRIPRELFTTLLIKSKYANSVHFSLRFKLGEGKLPRIGVSVSKKVSKSAVVRNTIRRRVYSFMRPFLSILPVGLYLLVAKPRANLLKGEKLKLELKQLLKDAKLIV